MRSTTALRAAALLAAITAAGCATPGPTLRHASVATASLEFTDAEVDAIEARVLENAAAVAGELLATAGLDAGAALVEAPLVIRARGPLADLRATQARFAQHLAHAGRHGAGADRPIDDTDGRFDTLADYLAHVTAHRDRIRATRPMRFVAAMRDAIEGATARGGLVPIAGPTGSAATLAAVRRECTEYADDTTLGPATTAAAHALGARYVVRSSLRPTLRGDRIRVAIVDLRTGRTHTAAAAIDPTFKAAVDRVTTDAR